MAALPTEAGERRGAVLIDRYLFGTEVDVDAVSDGETVVIPGLMEHVERAGVHSGDSMAAYPAPRLGDDVRDRIVADTVLHRARARRCAACATSSSSSIAACRTCSR